MIEEHIKKCIDRLQDMRVGIMWDGRFYDETTKHIVRDNHIKCILKNDTGLRSKEIEISMEWMKKNIAKACEANKHLVQDMEIVGVL